MIRQCPMQTHIGLHHSYTATLVKYLSPLAHGTGLHTRAQGREYSDRGGYAGGSGGVDASTYSSGRGEALTNEG